MALLDGRTALVVGASSGLGWGIALRFAEEGANVVAAARRTDRLHDLAEEAVQRGFQGRIVTVECDVDVEADLDRVVATTVSEFGRVDILAAIAQGGLGKQTYLNGTTAELALESYRTGPLYTMLLMQKVFPYMEEQGYGRIITCASGSAVSGTTGFTAYAMAKAAVMTLTRKAAQEWAQYGILTNCLLPVTKSDHFGEDEQSTDALRRTEAAIPVRYLGDPYEDASPVVAFLASEGAHYLNGQMVGLDGGLQILA
ncbi:SDR family NAD(P)-dependent oxidoreductase [Streptomyces sp. NPDC048282]|uniref:SDR family NAD(P)-dependent oxidoreductase n=1 Tax=Streptomyces sp. NPDC048282 TaxID=3365528 RepID=UPI00371CDFBD